MYTCNTILSNRCSKCNKIVNKNNTCIPCIENYIYKTYNSKIFDSIEDESVRTKYFQMHINSFWNEFCKKTSFNHILFNIFNFSKTFIEQAINTGYKEKSFALIFLILNGYINIEPVMFTSNVIDEYITTYFKNNKLFSENDIRNLIIILGQSVVDPWNSTTYLIKSNFSNGKLPSKTNDIFKLWFDNKDKVYDYFKTNNIYQCECGFKKTLKDYDMKKTFAQNKNHQHILNKDKDFSNINANNILDKEGDTFML